MTPEIKELLDIYLPKRMANRAVFERRLEGEINNIVLREKTVLIEKHTEYLNRISKRLEEL